MEYAREPRRSCLASPSPYRLLEGRGQPDVDAEEAVRAAVPARQLDGRHTHDCEGQPVNDDCAAQH